MGADIAFLRVAYFMHYGATPCRVWERDQHQGHTNDALLALSCVMSRRIGMHDAEGTRNYETAERGN